MERDKVAILLLIVFSTLLLMAASTATTSNLWQAWGVQIVPAQNFQYITIPICGTTGLDAAPAGSLCYDAVNKQFLAKDFTVYRP